MLKVRGQGGEVLSAGPYLTNTKELVRNANSGGKLITMITEFRILRRIKKAGSQTWISGEQTSACSGIGLEKSYRK